MANLIQQIKSIFFDKAEALSPGLYSFQPPKESENQYRLHLRIESGGEGLLIINASTVLHLNQTATEYAYHLIKQTPKPEIVESVVKRYQTSYADVTKDLDNFMQKIETLIDTPDLDPVTYLDFDRSTPYLAHPIAPYRLDAALTYKLRGEDEYGLTPEERVKRELTFDEWIQILEKAWQAGIPHVIFTGGEPTLRPDIIDLIKATEKLGLVSGLSTDGIRLSENEFLEQILNSGLDHLLITLNEKDPQALEALRDVIPQDIHTSVHVTIEEMDNEYYLNVFNELKKIGVENISLSYIKPEFEKNVLFLRNKAAEYGFNLDWDLPVPYSQYNPVSAEIDVEGLSLPSGAGKGWLYLEPDGDVLPSQGYNKVLGNFLEDDFNTIWENAKALQMKNE